MKVAIPNYFKSVLWEYDISAVDANRSPKLLIEKALNYGDLRHWKWIAQQYGVAAVRHTLTDMPTTGIRPGARALADIVFSGAQ